MLVSFPEEKKFFFVMSVLLFLSTHILENFKWDKMGNWVGMKSERTVAGLEDSEIHLSLKTSGFCQSLV